MCPLKSGLTKLKGNNMKTTDILETTTDYSLFNMNSEQPDTQRHTKKLRDSIIRKKGNLAPIIVDKDMKILDGHGRFALCKELELPLRYVVIDDTNGDAMIELNITGTNWKSQEWIDYYSNVDNNYVVLKRSLEERKLPLGFFTSYYGISSTDIAEGNIGSLDIDVINTDADNYFSIRKLTKIRLHNPLHRALRDLRKDPNFDIEKLIKLVGKHFNKVSSDVVEDESQALMALCKTYKYGSGERAVTKYYHYIKSL